MINGGFASNGLEWDETKFKLVNKFKTLVSTLSTADCSTIPSRPHSMSMDGISLLNASAVQYRLGAPFAM